MCGIVGMFAFSRERMPSPAWMRSLLDTIAHRGPDDEGVLIDQHAALGFRRLAILDLSDAGCQPMTSVDGVHSLVFNGEIYNYIELRAELVRLGHRFRSTGDSEVLLAAYRQWGADCVEKLVGMFAFCVVDRQSGTTFMARDRFGIKPLFYLRHEHGILVSSEIKAIRASGLWEGTLNRPRLSRFLSFGSTEHVDEDSETYYVGIEQLLAGHSCIVRRDGAMTFRRYWAPERGPRIPSRHVLEEFSAAFDDSMRLQMRSDVPVGVMLSGGMDSVSIACAMAARGPADGLHAFCYASEQFDETKQLDDVVAMTGATQHITHGLAPEDFWARLRTLMWHQDQPVHSASALMGLELYRMAAAAGIKVVLGGQGADETLGGYHNLFDHVPVSELLDGRLNAAFTQARIVSTLAGRSMSAQLLRTVAMLRGHVSARRASYRAAAARRSLAGGEGAKYLTLAMQELARPVEEQPAGQTLHAALVRYMTRSPLPHYLRVEDRNSMAYGIEARVPFLDHRLVELAMRLPTEWKMYDGWNKRVLREAMKDRIPDSVRLRRQKFGFPTSVSKWFAGPLASGLRDIVEDSRVMRTGWFDQNAVRQAFDGHLNGKPATNLLFNIAQLDAWLTLHESGQASEHRATDSCFLPS